MLPVIAQCLPYQSPPPGITGIVSGLPVTVILNDKGMGDGATDGTVFWNDPPSGRLVSERIEAQGPDGRRMRVFFRDSHLYTANAIHLPNEAYCCNSHVAVHRLKMVHNGIAGDGSSPFIMVSDGEAIVPFIALPTPTKADECPVGTYNYERFKQNEAANEELEVNAEFTRFLPAP